LQTRKPMLTRTLRSQATITEGPTDFQYHSFTKTAGYTGVFSQSCSVSDSTYAVCVSSAKLTGTGTAGTTTTSVGAPTTISGNQFIYGTFPITAGARKLANATGSCTAGSVLTAANFVGSINSSSSSGEAAVAAPTGMREVYKVFVVPAAAMAAVGAAVI
jgi:hypothetical protein